MERQLKVFQNEEFGELGIVEIEGKEYFPATEAAKMLGYADPHKAIQQHCKEHGWAKCPVIDSMGRTQEKKFINEGNLYRLIIKSKLPSAERFERWVFEDVLPQIRQTGKFAVPKSDEPLTNKDRVAIARILAFAPKDRLNMVGEVLKPLIGDVDIGVKQAKSFILQEQQTKLQEAVEQLIVDSRAVLKKLSDTQLAIDKDYFSDMLKDLDIPYTQALKTLEQVGRIRKNTQGKRTSPVHVGDRTVRCIVLNLREDETI